jgi:SAM-dependent methyltransferase
MTRRIPDSIGDSEIDFDDYASDYDRLLHEGTGFFADRESYFAQYKIDILRRQIDSSIGRILDFGCGIGRNIPFLRAAFPQATIVGYDPSKASLARARIDHPGVVFIGDLPNDDVCDPYDLILVACVFHHIPLERRPIVTSTLHQRLRPGGSLVVFEHNPFNPITRKIVRDCPFDRDAVLLRRSESRRLLSAAGFSDVRGSYCLFIPPSLPRLLRFERMLGWLPLGGQYWLKARRDT